MSLDEEQELAILEIFVIEKIEQFSFQSMPQSLKDLIGGGDWVIIHTMANKGLFLDTYTSGQTFEFTNAGRTRYFALKRKRKNEWKAKIAAALTLVAAVAAALYAGLTYHGCNVKKPSSNHKLQETQTPPKPSTPKQMIPDTIKVHRTDSVLNKEKK